MFYMSFFCRIFFNKTNSSALKNGAKLKESLNTIDWHTTFCGTSVNFYLDVAIHTISEKCTMFVPLKQRKKVRFRGFIMKERSL